MIPAIDSVRVHALPDGTVGFWIPKEGALLLRGLLGDVLPRCEQVLALYRRRAVLDSLRIGEKMEEIAVLERTLANKAAIIRTYEAELVVRKEAETLRLGLLRKERWRYAAVAAAAGGIVVFLLAR